MKNVDLEQKYFTLQQENSQLHSQNESLRSATNSETCSLMSSSEYAAIIHSPTSTNGHADLSFSVADVTHSAADVTHSAADGKHSDDVTHSIGDFTSEVAEERQRMREELSRLMADKEEVEELLRSRETECNSLRQQLGKCIIFLSYHLEI
jgi:cell division septum initiation protein DivIVA